MRDEYKTKVEILPLIWLIIGLVFFVIAAMFAYHLPPFGENPTQYTIGTIYMLASLFFGLWAWIFGEILDVKEEIRKLREDR